MFVKSNNFDFSLFSLLLLILQALHWINVDRVGTVSHLLNFGVYSFLCFHGWDCLSSASVCSYPLMIFCSAGLVVMNLLNLFWFWIVFISLLILRDNFAKKEDLHYQLLTSRLWHMLFHAFLSVSDERYYLGLRWYFPLCILLWFLRFAALIYCLYYNV